MMTFAEWVAAVRMLLPDPDPGNEWTDGDMGQYYREGCSPQTTAAELAFREIARS